MKLNDILLEKEMTTEELADLTGLPKRTLDGYRIGRREPSFSKGLKIATALKVSPYELLGDEK